jgi:hypothetical protein
MVMKQQVVKFSTTSSLNGVKEAKAAMNLILITSVALDNAGNVYVADRENNRIQSLIAKEIFKQWQNKEATSLKMLAAVGNPSAFAIDDLFVDRNQPLRWRHKV